MKNQNNLPIAIDYSDPKMLETLRATVAKGATNEELFMFVELCKASELNPFKNEAWFIKAGGRPMIMTGINGFLAVANSYKEFDGLEVEVDDDLNPTKATCKVWRKDRKLPSVGVALMKEFGRASAPIWKEKPRVMLTKVAKAIALREAFPQKLNNVYEEAEFDQDTLERDGQPAPKGRKRAPAEHRYNMDAIKEFIPAGQEAPIKARLKQEFGASFDKETGELVTKKLVPGWDKALSINVKAAQAIETSIGEDDLPDTWIDPDPDEAEAHFSSIVAPPAMTIEEAKAEVQRLKKKSKKAPEPEYIDTPIKY